ncbi:MAG TPA: hypothetical protein VMI94_23855 [Bryobacteraceae bacterium]|nr:hypothetical protein [Bryobacteraceae bacterium]
MNGRLQELEKDLRDAVAHRNYEEVRHKAADYAALAAREWHALAPADPRARAIFERLLATLEWTHQMVCISRAHTAARLRRVRLSTRYLGAGSTTQAGLRFDI